MLLNLLGLGTLIFLAYVFFTLFLKSVRSHQIAARILGGALSGLVSLLFVAALGAALFGLWRTSVPRIGSVSQEKVTSTPESISRGQSLAQSCIPCHSADGGSDLNGGMTNLVGIYGQVYGPNLTPGGPLAGWKDGEVIRAVRQGYDHAGIPLISHPAGSYAALSDDDAAALVSYLRGQTALRHDQPRRHLNLLGLWAAAAGLVPTSEPLPFVINLGGRG